MLVECLRNSDVSLERGVKALFAGQSYDLPGDAVRPLIEAGALRAVKAATADKSVDGPTQDKAVNGPPRMRAPR